MKTKDFFLKNIQSVGLWMMGSLFFLCSFVCLMFCLFLFSRRTAYSTARVLFRIMIRLMGIRLEVSGQQHIREKHAYLLMGNHQSLFDLFVIPCAIPFSFVGIEAVEHFSIPLWGRLIKKWGNIPISREDRKAAVKSLESAARLLKQGTSIGVLPEGHRTRTGKIQSFKKGPFYLALASGVDILPFGVKGLYQYQQKGSFRLNPGMVQVCIGKPLLYEDYRTLTADQLKNRVQETIEALAA